ncbi:MAG: hypothetical protein WBB21_00080 [Saprospiraceae bacterium]
MERALEKFVETYNNERYHESLENLTPADVYFGRAKFIIKERIKLQCIRDRKIEYEKLYPIKIINYKQKELALN